MGTGREALPEPPQWALVSCEPQQHKANWKMKTGIETQEKRLGLGPDQCCSRPHRHPAQMSQRVAIILN